MNADKVYQMNWSVYFILAVSIASIAWGVVNYFFVSIYPLFYLIGATSSQVNFILLVLGYLVARDRMPVKQFALMIL